MLRGPSAGCCRDQVVQTRIAIVDDDPTFRALIAEFLSDEEHIAVHWNGTEAPLAPLDLRLPHKLDGLELREPLRWDTVLSRMPVTLCSADRPMVTQLAERPAQLAATVLHKPFDLDTLRRVVQSLLWPADASTAIAKMGPLRCHV